MMINVARDVALVLQRTEENHQGSLMMMKEMRISKESAENKELVIWMEETMVIMETTKLIQSSLDP